MKLAVFDIGGSAVKYGLWSEKQLSQTNQFKTPATYEEMQQEMKRVITDFGDDIAGVAISAPGAVNTKERCIDGISAVSYLHHRPIFNELEASLGLPVAIENDANCAGICEVEIGAGKKAENAVFVVIGTGVGGAIFINRKIYKGTHLFGGEFGLMKNRNGKTLSQNGTAVKIAERFSQAVGEEIDGRELFARYDAGDELATKYLDEMYQFIAEVLYNIQVSIDSEMIIIGGGISARKELAPVLSERLEKMLVEEGVAEIMPTISTCEYQNDANLIGAAVNFMNLQSAK